MAKEIKTFTVHPSQEARTIRAYQCFGWTLLNNQEVYSKDSHLEAWGKKTYSVTQTTHYVKLTFERDPAHLPNYAQLRQLESAYYAVPHPGKKPFFVLPKAFYIGMGIYVGFIVLILSLVAKDVFMGLVIGGTAAAILYTLKKAGDKKMAEWVAKDKKCWQERERIIQKTDAYL